MSVVQPNQMITEAPGMEPYTGQTPSREVVTIPADKVTPQMYNHAINSPNRLGVPTPEMAPAPDLASTEVLGSTVTGSLVEIDTSRVQ